MADIWERRQLDEKDLNEIFGYKEQNIPTTGGTIPINWNIQIVPGFGDLEDEPDYSPSVWTASHMDLERIQLKAFHRLLVLNRLSKTFAPVVDLNVLRNIWRAPDTQAQFAKQVGQATRFLKYVFCNSRFPVKIVDEKTELGGEPIRMIIEITKFHDAYKELLSRLKEETSLENDSFLSDKEKEFLGVYLYRRKKLERELEKYPYPCWIMAILENVKPTYLVADASIAGLQVLMKYMAHEAEVPYFPSTIVLPHPRTLSDSPMLYFDSGDRKELDWNETLYVHDSLSDIKQKFRVDSRSSIANTSGWWYLSFIVNNIVGPFAPDISKEMFHGQDMQGLTGKYKGAELLKLIVEAYWKFIKPYYTKIEEICGTKETLNIDASKDPKILRVLANSMARGIFETLANQPYTQFFTIPEIASLMRLPKEKRTIIYPQIKKLMECKLVEEDCPWLMKPDVKGYRLQMRTRRFKVLRLHLNLETRHNVEDNTDASI